jgi:hypothetical protein
MQQGSGTALEPKDLQPLKNAVGASLICQKHAGPGSIALYLLLVNFFRPLPEVLVGIADDNGKVVPSQHVFVVTGVTASNDRGGFKAVLLSHVPATTPSPR